MIRRWVHLSYSRDLQVLGYDLAQRGSGPFDAFDLSVQDWTAFAQLYDEQPALYEAEPSIAVDHKR
jgi:hypothetical protein